MLFVRDCEGTQGWRLVCCKLCENSASSNFHPRRDNNEIQEDWNSHNKHPNCDCLRKGRPGQAMRRRAFFLVAKCWNSNCHLVEVLASFVSSPTLGSQHLTLDHKMILSHFVCFTIVFQLFFFFLQLFALLVGIVVCLLYYVVCLAWPRRMSRPRPFWFCFCFDLVLWVKWHIRPLLPSVFRYGLSRYQKRADFTLRSHQHGEDLAEGNT